MCSPMDTSASIRQMMAEETARQTPRRETCAERTARLTPPTLTMDEIRAAQFKRLDDMDARLKRTADFVQAFMAETEGVMFYGPGAGKRQGATTPPRDAVVRDQGFGGTRKFYASEAV